MRELRTCDFCAADAAGAFEIVPPELEPTAAEQRRVVCCPDCRERLETLLEPLLARAGAGTADTSDENDADGGSAGITAAGSVTADTADTESDDSTSEPAANESDLAPETASVDADESGADGITLERDEHSERPAPADEIANASATEAESSVSPPRAYSKVIRLLRNRDVPMTRSAVEELATGAYDLESDEAAAIVDYAIEDGEFVENGGKLRRP